MWMFDFILFYNSGSAILTGVSPYSLDLYYSPIFLALFFVPFSLLPMGLSYAVFLFINLFLAWKLLKSRIVWAVLFFPFLFSLFVGQVDFLLMALILLGSPWTIGLMLVKPQVSFVVIPWIVLSFSKKDWIKASISTALFILLGSIIHPTWFIEWIATQPTFEYYARHASNLYWLIPSENIHFRSIVIFIGSIIVLPFGFLLTNRKDSWNILHLFGPLTNIYSPVLLLEWIGPIEVGLSWLAVLLVGGNIHTGMPFFLVGVSIAVRSLLEYKKNVNKNLDSNDFLRPKIVILIHKLYSKYTNE